MPVKMLLPAAEVRNLLTRAIDSTGVVFEAATHGLDSLIRAHGSWDRRNVVVLERAFQESSIWAQGPKSQYISAFGLKYPFGTDASPTIDLEDLLSDITTKMRRLESTLATVDAYDEPKQEPDRDASAGVPARPSEDADGPSRPRVFIGSSAEGLNQARAMQVLLEHDCECDLWAQGLFQPGGSTLESLVEALSSFDFAILVVTPDDTATTRGVERNVTRDNVVFELGLFIGYLGHKRVFMVYDRHDKPDLPSDLLGVTPATYLKHSQGNWQAALGPAATHIGTAIERLGRISG